MSERLVIWGASGHALVVADIVRLEHRFEIVGAGAVVIADVPERAVVFGVPAVVQRYVELHALEKRN
jgi:acetyltransferase-like isoleucine patch superfamily enzyme